MQIQDIVRTNFPYSAKYIPQIPQYIIKYLSKKNDVVLDMFLGKVEQQS